MLSPELNDMLYTPPRVIAPIVGIPEEFAILLCCEFYSFFAGFGLSLIDSVPVRKVYNVVFGLLICSYFYGIYVLGAIAYCLILYVCLNVIGDRV